MTEKQLHNFAMELNSNLLQIYGVFYGYKLHNFAMELNSNLVLLLDVVKQFINAKQNELNEDIDFLKLVDKSEQIRTLHNQVLEKHTKGAENGKGL